MNEFNDLFDEHLFDIDKVKEKTVKLTLILLIRQQQFSIL